MSVNLKGQRQAALVIFFSLGFFIFGVSKSTNKIERASLVAHQEVKAPTRGIASE